MRALFFLLLLANVVVLLLHQLTQPSGANADRLAQQVSADRLRLIDPAAPTAAAPIPSCVEAGDFNPQTLTAFEQQLSTLGTGLNPRRRTVQAAASQLIFIPPLHNEEQANRRLAQLRSAGFNDSAVIRDEPTRRWGISLGRFTRTELAQAHLEKLRAAGVNDAQIGEYPVNTTRYAVQVSVADADLRERLKALATRSGGATLRACQ